MTDRSPELRHFSLILLLALTWGSSFILMKFGLFGLGDGITGEVKQPLFSSWQIAALRIAIAGTILMPLSIPKFRSIPRGSYKWLIAVGLIGNTIPAFLFTAAQTRLASSIAGILNSLTPLFTLVVAMIVFGNRYRRNQLIGLLIGFVGATGLISLRNDNGEMHLGSAFLVVLATICYAFSVNIIRNRLSHLSAVTIASVSLGIMAIPNILFLCSTDLAHVIATRDDAIIGLGATFVLGALGTAGALILFNGLIKETSALFASSVTYIIPVFASLWGVIAGEHLSIWHFVYMLIILSGVYLVNQGSRRLR